MLLFGLKLYGLSVTPVCLLLLMLLLLLLLLFAVHHVTKFFLSDWLWSSRQTFRVAKLKRKKT